jgi:mannose-6-phosphate isomerase-like protein (cupin superfamily)
MRLEGIVRKTWGHENIFITNDLYCGKHLVFDGANSKTSMHYHLQKHETWRVVSGKFLVKWIDTQIAQVNDVYLNVGGIWTNQPGVPHQLISLEASGVMLEISTADSVEDNYRLYR